jgi:hypothetical protein
LGRDRFGAWTGGREVSSLHHGEKIGQSVRQRGNNREDREEDHCLEHCCSPIAYRD